jgi:hypothetical protein
VPHEFWIYYVQYQYLTVDPIPRSRVRSPFPLPPSPFPIFHVAAAPELSYAPNRHHLPLLIISLSSSRRAGWAIVDDYRAPIRRVLSSGDRMICRFQKKSKNRSVIRSVGGVHEHPSLIDHRPGKAGCTMIRRAGA